MVHLRFTVLEYAIPILMFVYDFLIFCAMVIGLVCVRCRLKKKWYHVGIAPVACMCCGSFLSHHCRLYQFPTPHQWCFNILCHCDVTMRAAYYNLFHLYAYCKYNKNVTDCCKIFFIATCLILFSPIVLFLLCLHCLKCLDVTSCLLGVALRNAAATNVNLIQPKEATWHCFAVAAVIRMNVVVSISSLIR